jgi:hypothetical protein
VDGCRKEKTESLFKFQQFEVASALLASSQSYHNIMISLR